MPTVANPLGGGALDRFDTLEVLCIGLQPRRQRWPLPQQTLMGQLDDVSAGAPIGDQKSRLYKPLHHSTRVLWEFVASRHATPREVGLHVDAGEPGNKGRAQDGELLVLRGRIAGASPGRASARLSASSIDSRMLPSPFSGTLKLPTWRSIEAVFDAPVPRIRMARCDCATAAFQRQATDKPYYRPR